MARPGVVWFGEMLPEAQLRTSFQAAREAELGLVVGTSALVHPAASIPRVVLESGGELAEINPEPTPISDLARWVLRGRAGDVLPNIV